MKRKLTIPGIGELLQLRLHDGVDVCVSKEIAEKNIWEPYETSLIVEKLRKGDVFLDIGANIGYYTVIASTIVGEKGKVIAYEPDEKNFELLAENVELNRLTNVHAFPAALSDCSGSGYIYLCENNKGDHRIYDTGESRKKLEIKLINADEHVPQITNRIDFIKIDTQGSETRIINGLKKLIEQNANHLSLIVEFWPYGLAKAGSSGHELLEILFSFDMSFFLIDHIEHRLIAVTKIDMLNWLKDIDSIPDNQGFANLFLAPQAAV